MAEATHVNIRIRGHLDPHWSASLAGLKISHEANGETIIVGPVPDQAALHGLLNQLFALGLTLISVQQSDVKPVQGHEANR
jgi:hypothetical protein